MTELVNQRLADALDDFVVRFALVLDRELVKGNAIGQGVPEAGGALGQRRALVQPEQCFARLDLHLLEHVVRGLILDDDGEVLYGVAELSRNRRDGVVDEALEPFSLHLAPCRFVR